VGRPSPDIFPSVLSGSDLTALAAQRRKLADQALGLLAAVVVFGAVAASDHFRVFTGLAAVVSLAGAGVMSYLYAAAADDVRVAADELILHRYPYDHRDDRASRIVARRARTIDSPGYRRKLGVGLRRRMAASEHRPGRPIAMHTAQTLSDHRSLVDGIAAGIQEGKGDPATLVKLDRLLRAPNLSDDLTQDAEIEALEVELQRIADALVT
jgi:hypothetical protein